MNKHGYKKAPNGNSIMFKKDVVGKNFEILTIRVGGSNFGEADLIDRDGKLIAKNEEIELHVSADDYDEMLDIVSAWNDECDKELIIPMPDAATVRAMFYNKDMFWGVVHKHYRDIAAAIIMAILVFVVLVIAFSF